MDFDNSGLICFTEFERMVRKELYIGPRELQDTDLRAVFMVLDADSSGFLRSGEFGAFMRRGEQPATAAPRTKPAWGCPRPRSRGESRLTSLRANAQLARQEVLQENAKRAQHHVIAGLRQNVGRYEEEAKMLEQELEDLATSAEG